MPGQSQDVRLATMLQHLSEWERQLLTMRYERRLTIARVARELGLTEKEAQVRIATLLAMIGELLLATPAQEADAQPPEPSAGARAAAAATGPSW